MTTPSTAIAGGPQPRLKGASTWIFPAIFVALTFWPAFFFFVEPVNLQNRALTPFPEISLASAMSPETYLQAGKFVEDRMPFKDQIVDWNGRLRVTGFHTTTTPDVILTSTPGWYDHRESLVLPCLTDAPLDTMLSNADQFNALMTSMGKRFIFAMAPQKATLYTERLPAEWQANYVCALKRLDAFRVAIAQGDRPFLIDSWAPFFEAKATTDAVLSDAQDSHWSSAGSVLMTELLVETLSPGIWNGAKVTSKQREFLGDLSRKLGISQRVQSPRVTVTRPGVTSKQVANFRAGSNTIRTYESTGTAELLPRTVIIHDSYGLNLLSQLPPFFSRIDFVHTGAVDSDPAARIFRDADIVIVMTAERFGYSALEKLPDSDYTDLFKRIAANPN